MSLLSIYQIDEVAVWVISAQVHQDKHNLVADHIYLHIEKVDRQGCVKLEVRFPYQQACPARLKAGQLTGIRFTYGRTDLEGTKHTW